MMICYKMDHLLFEKKGGVTDGNWILFAKVFIICQKKGYTTQLTIVKGNVRIPDAHESNEEDPILLILDSSFNPPHWGHYTLIKKSYEHYSQLYPNKNLHVLLLLSIQNANKEVKLASFDKRMEMMCIMSRLLNKDFENLSSHVGLTMFGKFVDKDAIIR